MVQGIVCFALRLCLKSMACKLQSRFIDTSCLEIGSLGCISLEKIIASQMLGIILRHARHATGP